MTINELRAEAEKLGYRLQKIPDYDCSCYIEYPNPNHMRKNGTWICIDRYENIKDYEPRTIYSPITHCKKKDGDSE